MLEKGLEGRKAALSELSAATSNGKKRRRALHEAVTHTCHEFHGLGIEMGQRYSGLGVYDIDEKVPYMRQGKASQDSVLYYEPGTYPGCRLPHVWLNRAVPENPVSTIDLAGHGAFTLFTGTGGSLWKKAADNVCEELNVPLKAYFIGFRQEWEDVYYDWEKVMGVDETGAILVRPDRFVAWRAAEVMGGVDACEKKLSHVLRSVLGY